MFLRYFIELSYLGKNYHGWQRQNNAISIQEVLEESLSLLLRDNISVVGCGRTDTGVHASQFYLHFDVNKNFEVDKLKYQLNAFLSKEISIDKIFLVAIESHARFDAIYRSYEYRIYLGRSPFLLDVTWQVQNMHIDINKMNEAAKLLYEYQNFKCFSRSRTDVKTYNCTITHVEWVKTGNLLVFHITANRFLRNMVRAIVGTLWDVGLDKINIDDFRRIIESEDRTQARVSAKAKGLFLTEIAYPKDILIKNNGGTK